MSDAESDDGRRASKKRKASRACDRCNVQHQPCDNASPKCSVCERAGTECTYNRPIRKRGPRTGYTAQYGERLWGLVLRANPELEDMVLRILSSGTHGNSGASNADYFKNSDHQSELVNRFNESRLGRFVHSGELPSIEELRKSQTPAQATAHLPAANSINHSMVDVGSSKPSGPRSRRSTVSVTSKASPSVNPHGAPQNPGDIYTLSEDIRKRPSYPELAEGTQAQVPPAQLTAQTPDWQSLTTPANNSNDSLSFDFMPDSFTHDYGSLLRTPVQGGRGMSALPSSTQTSSIAKGIEQPGPSRNIPNLQSGQQSAEFDLPDINQWYDSIPTDTLLNLGFTGGEGMARDFLDLCENPDPIDSAPISPSGQDEDEEAVWRRLVMRGRFV
ncbi:hypothetical protein AB5N19_11158 [Seiridium cardinale]|uniref:Zn(2)-C6 fungal-type domain-containing protein n=1 Tax=Seiridium cardinale TaxID=138064 RepID=A0ABR2XS18_9PEZI